MKSEIKMELSKLLTDLHSKIENLNRVEHKNDFQKRALKTYLLAVARIEKELQ
jgi:hypothetical protein